MHVLVNAISVREGGGLVVLIRLLAALSQLDSEVTWHVAAEPGVLTQLPDANNIKKIMCGWQRTMPWHLLYWYEVKLPKLIQKTNTHVCFSVTNFLPRRSLSCPSLLLMHNAGYFSEKFKQLHLQWHKKYAQRFLWAIKNNWVRRSIKCASLITVQTDALAEKISKQLGIAKEKIVKIAHGAGLLKKTAQTAKSHPADSVWRIGYITKFGVQKDFTTAFQAMSLLKKQGIQLKFILTLHPSDPDCIAILNLIQKYEIADVIENHGEIFNPDEMQKLYDSLHIFIFPSLCESFGFTLVEAMAAGLPVIVAATESNQEVAGKAGQEFIPENPQHLAEKIQLLMNDKEAYTVASQASIERSREFSWDQTAKNILKTLQNLQSSSQVDNCHPK